MAGRWLREHVIQLGHVGDDRLLVRFGGIDICKQKKYAMLRHKLKDFISTLSHHNKKKTEFKKNWNYGTGT